MRVSGGVSVLNRCPKEICINFESPLTVAERGWTKQQAAEHLHVAQSRVSDLVQGKWEKFSLDMLVTLAARAGCRVELAMV